MIVDIVLVGATGRGGLENVIKVVSDELIRRGNRVRVIQVFNPIYKEWIDEIKEFYALVNSEFTREVKPGDMVKLYADFLVKEGRPDTVIATHVPASTYLWYESLRSIGEENIPIISWVHGPLPAYGDNYDKLLSFADAHIAISEEIQNQLIGLSKKVPVYLTGNPICIDIDDIKIERDNTTLQMIYVGRLEKEKRVLELVNLLKDLDGDWQLNIIGDGSEKENILNKINRYNLSENIKMCGWIDNPWESIKKANLLIQLSIQEGFGISMIEALSLGVPVLSTRTEGALDIIENEVNGWLVDIDNLQEAVYIIKDIINNFIKLPSKEVCKKSVDRFNAVNIVDKIERAIEIEINKKKSSNRKNISENGTLYKKD